MERFQANLTDRILMKKFRCGIVGCGRIGCGFDDIMSRNLIRTHALSYYKNPKSDLVALCDVDKKKLEHYGKKFKIKNIYEKSKKMFEEGRLDCVSICTTASEHQKLVEEAVENNIKGIIVEKPISYSIDSARKIIETCKNSNVVLAINHQRRFDPFYHSLSGMINRRKNGSIQYVNVYYGGGIANSGSHIFDVLRHFFGDVKVIHANISPNSSNNALDPNLDVEIKFKNQIRCKLIGISFQKYGIAEIDILFEKNRFSIDLVTNQVKIFEKSKKVQDYNLLQLSKTIKSERPATDIRRVIDNFIGCVRTRKNPLCTGEDGYKSLELVVGSVISARLGKKLSIPIKNKNYKTECI